MKKFLMLSSIFLNLLLIMLVFQSYDRTAILENIVANYSSHYVPTEMYTAARDRVLDYEWILQHIAKVDNVDTMRMYWCGR